ncbi:hypothetical protein GL218_02868 [Daldinia childiae]|uniref:uncharacterized protein n=1 Tax=Daldinia childiae TaxID=326645 RepID=UPI0014471D6D|nr:uncharacterized protein GL218_02868 [Daldinia childiae]KAF3061879.1 hypothetical protein GL218_02868 [Daldinia childiae]
MSPESSSLFPDRPIRPLPKRRLRERLSPDVADSIQYPPAPQTSAPLFVYPYNAKEDLVSLGAEPPGVAHRENAAELGQETGLRRNGLGNENDGNSLIGQARRAFVSRPLHDSSGHATRAPLRQGQSRQPNPQPPPSTASSADGYDSFENSNNKKKRKIPTAGETILNGTHVLNDLGALGVSSPVATGDEGSLDISGSASTAYYQSGGLAAGGQGISGPGRGGVQYSSPPAGENSGIISSAIASAEKLQVPQGQENISLLHQETSTKSSPTSSAQFTFTFDSQNPVSWPGSDPAPSNMGPTNHMNQSHPGSRDSYNGHGARSQNGSGPPPNRPGSMQGGINTATNEAGKGAAQGNVPPKKSKRRGNSLLQAAKQRRKETEFQNFHHPPAPEDIWICEFCEYERIFGRPPEALIRQYEIKDRRRRREEAERRRLLEKAKMKSRKGKKAGKMAAKSNSNAPDRNLTSTSREVSPSEKGSDISRSRDVSPLQEENTTPRKKSVRVSFDDRTMATVVGESAGDIDESCPPSPQQTKRPWYSNIGRSKRKDFALEDDEIMKPRPALPSFGSIREKKPREPEERPLVRPQELAHSSDLRSSAPNAPSNSGTPDELLLGQSSDQVVGSIFVREQTPRNAPNISRFREPLPPVVTSVEGSGYISDSIKSSDSDDELLNSIGGASDAEDFPSTQITQPDTQDNSQSNSTILEKRLVKSEASVPNAIQLPPHDIPEIAVIQPSPKGPEQGTSAASVLEEPFFDVPGGFPDDGSDKTRDIQPSPQSINSKANGDASPSPIFEPKATVHPIQPDVLPQTTLTTTALLDAVDNESTDDSASIYSDAYEDPWNAEGDGFLSLNAVVEKPIDKTAPSQLSELPGDAPQGPHEKYQLPADKQFGAAANILEPVRHQDDWEQAKAFWRSLTAEKRLQLEREAMEEAGAEGDEDEIERPIRKNSVKKTTAQQRTATEAQPRSSTQPEDVFSANSTKHSAVKSKSKSTQEPPHQPAISSRMRMSLRGEKPGQALDGMRKTMRSHTGGPAKQSHRQTTQNEKSTPVYTKPIRQQAQQPPQKLPTKRTNSSFPSDKPPLQRHGSDASDSSFKRSRAARNSGFSLRSSMRPSSANPTQDIARSSGRFSLRSLSPTGSSFRQNSATNATDGAPTPTMRRTLRSSSVSSQERILPSIHFPSFGRSNKNPTTKRFKRSSRFGDSSDEDEGEIAGFRSRFDDSSDEESVRPSTSAQAGPLSRGTLRGSATGAASFRKSTPVPEVDEDSPTLPDSDNEMPSPMQSLRSKAPIGGAGLTRSNSEALGTATLTRSRSGRGGFDTSVSAPTTPNRERRSSLMGILRRNKRADPAGKIQRSGLVESAARRDTRLERSSEQLRDLRNDNSSSLRLQKRSSVKRNDSWPLGEPSGNETIKRSSSAGNLLAGSGTGGAAQRPELNDRRSTSLGLPTVYQNERDEVIVDGVEHKKKKKFGALRRIFGLND